MKFVLQKAFLYRSEGGGTDRQAGRRGLAANHRRTIPCGSAVLVGPTCLPPFLPFPSTRELLFHAQIFNALHFDPEERKYAYAFAILALGQFVFFLRAVAAAGYHHRG